MSIRDRIIRIVFATSVAWAGAVIGADTHGTHGPDYTPLERPQPTESPGKVEVIEFFWYGCPHCKALEPAVEAWAKRLPKDVVLRREHALWPGRSDMEAHARLFATLRTMGVLEQHQSAVFEAVHVTKLELRNESALLDWVKKRGMDPDKFKSVYKSFGIESQVGRAKSLTSAYAVSGVPSFAINGKYMTSLTHVPDEKQMFAVIDKLIAQERGKK